MTNDTRDKSWRPQIDLERLSAALAREIVAMPDGELRRLLAELGYPIDVAAQEVREVIAAACGEPEPTALRLVGSDGQRRIFVAL